MTFEEYQKEAVKFRLESANNEDYLTLGLISEVGEAAGKLAKQIRDGEFDEKAFIKELGDILWFVANLADFYDKRHGEENSNYLKNCLNEKLYMAKLPIESSMRLIDSFKCWLFQSEKHTDYLFPIIRYIASIASIFGYTLEQVAEINVAKLRSRANRGVIQGNGDER